MRNDKVPAQPATEVRELREKVEGLDPLISVAQFGTWSRGEQAAYSAGFASCKLSVREFLADLKMDNLAATPAQPIAPPVEPEAPAILEALSYHAAERDDLTLEDAVKAFRFGYKEVRERDDRAMLAQLIHLMASAPAAQPIADVSAPADEQVAEVCVRVRPADFTKHSLLDYLAYDGAVVRAFLAARAAAPVSGQATCILTWQQRSDISREPEGQVERAMQAEIAELRALATTAAPESSGQAAQEPAANAVPAGWQLVPVEPTKAMVDAAIACGSRSTKFEYYCAMLEAAPPAPQAPTAQPLTDAAIAEIHAKVHEQWLNQRATFPSRDMLFARAIENRLATGSTLLDAARLDFIEANPNLRLNYRKKHWSLVGMTSYEYEVFKTLREAIDAARLASDTPARKDA